jgi:hypothetical protein
VTIDHIKTIFYTGNRYNGMLLLKHHTGLFLILICSLCTFAQPVTGNWKGRLDGKKAEVKIIQNGDSITGTAYYFESAHNYSRYSIKGYVNTDDNSVVWWDDVLIDQKGKLIFNNASPLLSVADFNCPGGGKMYLNGKTSPKTEPEKKNGIVALTKTLAPGFEDEWDYVIENFTAGTNDPDIIDSIEKIALVPIERKPVTAIVSKPTVKKTMSIPPKINEPEKNKTVAFKNPSALTIEEKFTRREKTFSTEIPVTGDSIELRFYDNAEIDGDSISLFLNDKMIFTHIRLTDKPYTVKLAAKELNAVSELTMVAENLGSIPPNTSYMVAIDGDKRYTANLASTENSSAMIRLKKK